MGLLYLPWSIDRLHVGRESYNHKPFITISAIFIPQQHTVLSFKHLWMPCLVDLLERRHHWNHWNKWPCLLSLQGLLKIRIKCALQLDHINMNADRWWLALKETLWELQHQNSTSYKQTGCAFNILFFHIETHLQNQNWSLHIKCSTKQEKWMETFKWCSIQIYGTDLFSNMQ